MPLASQEIVGGRYRLQAVIGEGGSGAVWSAHDAALHRDVAVKILRIFSDEYKARVWREARLAALLGATSAVPIYDFGDDGEHCFLVMELMHAPTLRDVLEKGEALPMQQAVAIGCELMKALRHAHSLSIVHRDIKPENIFVNDTNQALTVRLVDFGLAFLAGDAEEGLGRLTHEPGLSGTPAYLSPEQAERLDIGPESDVYSAACVLYELACGTPPFSGAAGELISKQIYVPAIPLIERAPKTPRELSDLVDRMLVKDPKERPSSDAVVDALESLLQRLSAGTNRSARALRDVARADRMVSTANREEEHSAHEPVAWLQAPIPKWLQEKIACAGFKVVSDPVEASLAIAPVGVELAALNLKIPVFGWSPENENISIAELIRGGYHSVIMETTPANRLSRLASGLANKKHQQLTEAYLARDRQDTKDVGTLNASPLADD